MSDELVFDDGAEPLTPVVLDGLYLEAMQLTEEARTYFDQLAVADRQHMDPASRVFFSCESLKVTTRLMHVIAWLLVRKAVEAGEMPAAEATRPERRLGRASPTSAQGEPRLEKLPAKALAMIQRSQDLYQRVARIEAGLIKSETDAGSPVHQMLGRLEGLL